MEVQKFNYQYCQDEYSYGNFHEVEVTNFLRFCYKYNQGEK